MLKYLSNLAFWQKFTKNVVLGLSCLILFVGLILSEQSTLFERGPKTTLAQEYGYEDTSADYVNYFSDYQYSDTSAYYNDTSSLYQYTDPYSNEAFGGSDYQYTDTSSYYDTYSPSSSYNYVDTSSYYNSNAQNYNYQDTSSYYNWSPAPGYNYVDTSSYYNQTPTYSSYSEPSYTEGPGCNGTHAVWGKWNGSQLIEVEADYGETGECGYSSTPSYSQPSYSQPSYTQSSGTWEFKYPECDWNSRMVYDVYQHTGTGEYDRRNPHYQEDACGYNATWEGPGCQGNRSVWGVWNNSNRQQLISVERDYGAVPGECNNPVSTPTPIPTPSAYITAERQECDGRRLVLRRYWSDNRTPQIITNYGENAGYCGVQTYYQQPTYTAPQPEYSAPAPTYVAPVSQPGGVYNPVVVIPQIQAACTANADQITRGQSVTYSVTISTGGTGRVGRADFSGERSQSSASPTFTVRYDTSGVKHMTANVYDADARGGSQLVECPRILVYDQVTPVGYTQPVVTQPTYYYGTPVYQQPVYTAPQPQPNVQPTVVYTQTPTQTGVVTQTPNVDYCPQGYNQQINGGFVYCIANQPTTVQTQVAATPTTSTINCPSGYTAQTSGSTVYCVAQQGTSAGTTPQTTIPQTTTAPIVQTPQVVYKTADSLSELPKTGVPLVAWGVSALLPLGVKIRRRGSVETKLESSANSIWISRQLNKEYD